MESVADSMERMVSLMEENNDLKIRLGVMEETLKFIEEKFTKLEEKVNQLNNKNPKKECLEEKIITMTDRGNGFYVTFPFNENIKNHLKEQGGKWNPGLRGWVFPKSKQTDLVTEIKDNTCSGNIYEHYTIQINE